MRDINTMQGGRNAGSMRRNNICEIERIRNGDLLPVATSQATIQQEYVNPLRGCPFASSSGRGSWEEMSNTTTRKSRETY